MRILAIILLSIFCKPEMQTVPVAGKILEYCKKNLGKKVDKGECWDLANAALNYSGAAWESPYGFGDKVEFKKENLKPADILQFTNVKFMFKNGSATFPKHTAIIYKMNGSVVTLFHQNMNNKRYVDTLSISLDNLKNGKIEAYRPKGK